MPKIRQMGYGPRIEQLQLMVASTLEKKTEHTRAGQYQMADLHQMDFLALRETLKRENISKRLENNIKLLSDFVAGDRPGSYDEKAIVAHIREDLKALERVDRMEVV